MTNIANSRAAVHNQLLAQAAALAARCRPSTARLFRRGRATLLKALLLLPLSLALATGASADTAQSTDLGGAAAATENALPPLEPLEAHSVTAKSVLRQLRQHHYLKRDVNDQLSSQVFDKYLDILDGSRSFFLSADIEAFEASRYHLDEAFKQGNLTAAFAIFNRYQNRQYERFSHLQSMLADGLDKLDFSKDEQLETDRENAAWPVDEAALNDLWRRRLKSTVIAMRLNEKDDEEIVDLLSKRYRNRLKNIRQTKSEDAFQLYVNALATAYDPHTQYFSPRISENFNINMSLSLQGIGAVLRTDEDYTTVVRLVPAGPADKSRLIKPDDRIVGVGQGAKGKIIDVVGWRLDDVVELIRGPKDSVVKLQIQPAAREHSENKVISITRDTVKLEEQSAQKKLITLNEGRSERNIGVIEIPTFYVDFKGMQRGDPNFKSTTRDVARLIRELQNESNIDGLIIDLRNNGGGSLAEANSLTGLFIKYGPTVQVKAANRKVNVYTDQDGGQISWDGPLLVLVNRLSASASEIFAGAIQDYGRGLVVGGQTFGKGTVQTLIPLNRGQLKLTQAKFYRVSGQSTQHQGVLPDIEYPELFDVSRIGESSLDDALPWDVINPVKYRRLAESDDWLAALNGQHQARVANDPEFAYLRELAAWGESQRERKFISLNEMTRRAEQEADDKFRLDLENRLRKAKGEPLLTSLDDLEEPDEGSVHSSDDADNDNPPGDAGEHDNSLDEQAKGSDDRADDALLVDAEEASAEEEDEPDAVVVESANILVDFIEMTTQIVADRKTAGLSPRR